MRKASGSLSSPRHIERGCTDCTPRERLTHDPSFHDCSAQRKSQHPGFLHLTWLVLRTVKKDKENLLFDMNLLKPSDLKDKLELFPVQFTM